MSYQVIGTFTLVDAAPFTFSSTEWQRTDMVIVKLQDSDGAMQYREIGYPKDNHYGDSEPRIGATVRLGRDYSSVTIDTITQGDGRRVYTECTAQADYVPSPTNTWSKPYANEDDLKKWGRDKISLRAKSYLQDASWLMDDDDAEREMNYTRRIADGSMTELTVALMRAMVHLLQNDAQDGAYMLALMHAQSELDKEAQS